MTAKQYLKQAYRLNELINSDIQELEQLKALSKSISSPNLFGMPSGSKKQEAVFVNAIMKIVDLEKIINAEIDKFVDLKKEIRNVILKIPDNNYKLCLMLRYIQFRKWNTIAAEMNFSLKQVYRIHGKALHEVQKVLPYDIK